MNKLSLYKVVFNHTHVWSAESFEDKELFLTMKVAGILQPDDVLIFLGKITADLEFQTKYKLFLSKLGVVWVHHHLIQPI